MLAIDALQVSRPGPPSIWRTIVLVVGLSLIPLSLLAMSQLLNREFARIRGVRTSVEHSMRLRETVSKLLIVHLDVEAGTRGYVLTSNQEFLQPFNASLTRRDQLIADLMNETKTDMRSNRLAQDLKENSARKLAFSEDNIALVRTGHPDEARKRIATGQGKLLMDRIRRDVWAIDAIAKADMAAVTTSRGNVDSGLQATTSLLLTGIALLLAGIAALVGRTGRQRQTALGMARELHERSRAMFDGAVDGMLLLDSNGSIRRLNPSVVRMFGYSNEELLGQHNTFLMADPYPLEMSLAWLKSVGVADERGAGMRQEFTGRRADGTTFETEVAISRVPGDSDRLYVAAIRDISAQKRAEALKSEFVATVSHELRTPLTSIGGSLGLLEAGAMGQLGEKAARLVSIAHNNCQRLVRLINDILDIEKMESGSIRFDLNRIQLAQVIERTVNANSSYAQQHGVQLSTKIAPWPQCVLGDPDRLEQLLTNLLSNAIKQSPTGAEVEVVTTQDRGHARIEVRDRGAGIPHEFRKRIFTKFAMADSSDSRARGGTGLGLSIAREITNRHGGKIGYLDREGGGTTFFVEIPLVEMDATPIEPMIDDLPRILHVDDDADCLNVVASAFAGRAQVVSVTSVEMAENALKDGGFVAAIIDVGLPQRNGLELVPYVRKKNPELTIVLFTADDGPHGIGLADTVLIKSRATLEQLVEATLGRCPTYLRNIA